MIYNSYSLLFLYVTFIHFWCSGSSIQLKFLLQALKNIVRCSEYEYLVFTDWRKLRSSNISCPNQDTLFEKPPVPLYDFNRFRSNCNDNKQMFSFEFEALNLPLKGEKMPTFDNKARKQLSSTIYYDNHQYLYNAAKIEDNASMVLVNHIDIKWSLNNTFLLYTAFDKQPTICRFQMFLENKVNNKTCTGKLGEHFTVCYNDPLSTPSPINVNWTLLFTFGTDNTGYAPNNWQDKGGYYVDVRLFKTATSSTATSTTTTTTTTTVSTTTTATSTSTSTTTTSTSTSTTTTTTSTSTSTTTTATSTSTSTTTTSTSTSTTTTATSASTSTTTTTVSTTTITVSNTTTSTTTSITTTITSTITTISTIPSSASTTTINTTIISTAIVTSTSEASSTTSITLASTSKYTSQLDSTQAMTTTSTITSTNLHQINTTNMASTTIVLSNTTSKDNKIVKNITTRYTTSHSSRKTSKIRKPSRNDSVILRKSSANKNSASLFVILLICFIFCIIGSVLFFIIRSRRKNQQDDDQTGLNRMNSDESYESDVDETEINRSMDSVVSTGANAELPDMNKTRRGGRMISQFDPDGM